MLSYVQVAEAVGKSVETVREDRKAGDFDLEDLPSVVRYVAGAWGWMSPEQLKEACDFNPDKFDTAPELCKSPFSASSQVPVVGVSNPTWKVSDNTVRSGDPYLDRVKLQPPKPF